MELVTTCYTCGAQLVFSDNAELAQCEFCGRTHSRPKASADALARLKYANERMSFGELDAAATVYREILETNLDCHEARWGLLLCTYGVIYVENPSTGVRLPTCRKSLPTSFRAEPDFHEACSLAPESVRKLYERDGRYIDSIQREIRRIQLEEEPYDVFLCYKETDENGKRTADSILAQNIYQTLKGHGFRAFYAPVSLQNRLGANYEASIFCAVESAKVMLVLGTKPEYIESTWVRSEWKRFLDCIDVGEHKLLIPLYRGFSPDRLPSDFTDRFIQGLDMNDVGFMFVLESNLEKVIQKKSGAGVKPEEKKKIEKKKPEPVKFFKQEPQAKPGEPEKTEEPKKPYVVDAGKLTEADETEFAIASEGDDYRIVKYLGNRSQVIIPAEIRGRKVVAIGSVKTGAVFPLTSTGLFKAATNNVVEYVKVPETVREIERDAFRNCTALRRVELHHSIRAIGQSAFSGCKNIEIIDFCEGESIPKVVRLPKGLKSLGVDVFWDTGVREVTMSRRTKEPVFGGDRRVSKSIPAVFYYED